MEDWQIRIENKIDRMSEAIIQLARVDERVMALRNRTDSIDDRLEKLSERLDELETTSTKRGTTFDTMGTAFWYVFSAVASVIVASLFFWVNHD